MSGSTRHFYKTKKRKGGYSRRRRPPKIRPGADAGLKRIFAGIGVPDETPFKPDPYQIQALSAVKRSDCLVTAPTGSGKTWIAEQAIARILKKGGKSWYASPLKALSNTKYSEFSQIFGPENVGILTGDRKENLDAPVIVGTTEILRNQLYDAMYQGVMLLTDIVVLDEAHFLGDEDRGVVWEEIMIYLPPRIPLLLLSATIGNAKDIAHWLSTIRLKECIVVEETKRPVPLHALFFHPSGTLLPLLSRGSPKKSRLSKKVA
ncbi:MAG: DEAD/DEAH box helicase, partial [Desulfobacterales bacterium]